MISEHASPLDGLAAGAQHTHVAALAGALSGQGHQVSVYTRRDDPARPKRVDLGYQVVHVPAGPPQPLSEDELLPYMRSFGEWLSHDWERHGRPDVMHAHFWMSGVAGLVATAGTDIATALTFHALGTVERRYQQAADSIASERIPVEADLGRRVDLVFAQCPDERSELAAIGVPAEHIALAPSGVDTRRFAPDGPVAPRTPGLRRILAAGRLVERKGYDELLVALHALADTELVIAGSPASHLAADPEARRLRGLADSLGVADRFTLLGAVPAADMPCWYRSADLVACTPWYEPFGLTPLEAMACGVPVVTYAVGGLQSSIVDGVTGVHVPPGDVAGLVSALNALLDNPDQRRRLGAAARRRALRHYDLTRRAAAIATAYAELLARCGAAPVTV
jgi:glycosyltransferase involved in cell wall biosynthesis